MNASPDTLPIYRALVLLLVLAGLDQTIVSTALSAITTELGGQELMSWVFSAYLIASTCVIPLYGKLADRHGPRPALLAATALFLLGSVACALAPTMAWLVGARAVQGLGGGGLMTLTMVAVAHLFPLEERPRRQGMLGAAYALATMLGPLVGGVLVQQLHWRWTFVINAPLALFAWQTLWRAQFGRALPQRHRLDLAGALLLAGTLVSLLMATKTAAGEQLATAAWAGAALLLGAVLMWVERRAEDPVLPLALLRLPGFAAAGLASALSGVALFATVAFMPYYLQAGLGLSPTQSAWHLLPLMACLTVAARFSGRALRSRVSARQLALWAWVTIALAFAALALVLGHARSHAWACALAVAPLGAGLGLLFPVVTAVAQRAAPPQQMGIATAAPIMLRALGGALGVSALGSLLSQHMAQALGTPAGGASASALLAMAGPAVRERIAAAMAGGLQGVYQSTALLALLACIVALWLPVRLAAAQALPAASRTSSAAAK